MRILQGILATWLMLLCAAAPSAPQPAQTEIEHLLTFVGSSHCEFYRNGSWYDAEKAQSHLKEKLTIVDTGGKIATAEDFIDKVATKSAFTGLAYQIRCGGGAETPVNDWLRKELALYRRALKK